MSMFVFCSFSVMSLCCNFFFSLMSLFQCISPSSLFDFFNVHVANGGDTFSFGLFFSPFFFFVGPAFTYLCTYLPYLFLIFLSPSGTVSFLFLFSSLCIDHPSLFLFPLFSLVGEVRSMLDQRYLCPFFFFFFFSLSLWLNVSMCIFIALSICLVVLECFLLL